MTRLFLTPEQAQVLAAAAEPVQICDPQGKVVATVQPRPSAEEIAEARRRAASPGPWYTGTQVQARLRALQEEWDRTGGFDKEYMHELLDRLNEADPGHMRTKE
jgi:uncharacterized protein YmfQ (DUF2313 family)